jgi:hypothetical protein
MRKQIILLTFLLSTLLFIDSLAQQMPLVYNFENTGADCPIPYLPSFIELPTIQALPDPFMWADGRGRISNFSDWRYRRAEIGAQIQNYEIGTKPARPDSLTASYSGGILTVKVYKNGQTLTLTSTITLPAVNGPFPAIIGVAFGGTGSLPSDIFSSRNIATITYNHNQVTTYGSPNNSDPYYKLYPNLNIDNTGQYSAWAWGVSRIIDGLELVQNVLPIDLKHLAVTGCSYAGKLALFTGAFDERIALTISQESGGGGYTTWRYSQEIDKTMSVETVAKTDYNWFKESLRQFANDNVAKLPYDHHELMAMVAPRALLVTGNPSQIWLADESGYVGSKAAKEVWKALGVPDRFGYSIITDHPHCVVPSSQIPEIGSFVDKFLLGKDTTNTNIATTTYSTNLSPWIPWTTPTLANGISFFGKAYLVHPANLETGLDTTSITFQWNKAQEAVKYFFQLSLNPSFGSVAKSDSTTDTVKTITNLTKGKKYYWRIQIKSINGSGPWSEVRNFTTAVSLPGVPELASVTPYSNRDGWFTFKWKKTQETDQYLLQLSETQSFTSVLDSAITVDTSKLLTSLSKIQRYYWRVQANNIAGSGQWSKVSNFSTLPAPTDLALEKSGENEITLKWIENSTIEDGYIIERKQSPQTSFTVLDTLKGSGNEYIDNKANQAQAYTYRTKAYKDSVESDYSNEASLTVTDVQVEQGIPARYSISQNYPNPFNPTTKIIFALPQRSFTKLIMYDLLGREAQILINKELEAGYHEMNINGNNFPSGVYFYRIQSGAFIQTKKMILIK